ncbi:MAG: DUF1156 domain-containing protein [Desulfobacterales bacterium]|nr:DUF1156 domain-containing protein [Desulfobacterales bacterium]
MTRRYCHEKSSRHGHISTLHIWWARRPLAACRAVMCAAFWPDFQIFNPSSISSMMPFAVSSWSPIYSLNNGSSLLGTATLEIFLLLS